MNDERATLSAEDAATVRLARACIEQNKRWLAAGVIDLPTYRRFLRTPRALIARLERQ